MHERVRRDGFEKWEVDEMSIKLDAVPNFLASEASLKEEGGGRIMTTSTTPPFAAPPPHDNACSAERKKQLVVSQRYKDTEVRPSRFV